MTTSLTNEQITASIDLVQLEALPVPDLRYNAEYRRGYIVAKSDIMELVRRSLVSRAPAEQAEYELGEYQPGQWWIESLADFWGHGKLDPDTRRAAKIACDFAGLVFLQSASAAGKSEDRAGSAQPISSATESPGLDERALFEAYARTACNMPDYAKVNWDALWTQQAWEGWRARAAIAPSAATPSASDYEEVLSSHRRLVRELDVALNGEAGAAKQASLCDIVSQVKAEGIKSTGAAAPPADVGADGLPPKEDGKHERN